MEAEQIDMSKENIQPLRQGRVSSQLTEALNAQASLNLQIQQGIQKKIQEFEVALHTYDGPDPLAPWVDYINWVEQCFPKHGKEGNFPLLVRKCLEVFKDDERYKQDIRCVNLWITYIDMQIEARSETYDMVYNHGIGTKVARFYHCWAMELASNGDLRRADQVYKTGISAGAEPLEELEQAHKNLQFYVVKKGMETERTDNESDTRHALNSLPTIGARNLVPHERLQPLHSVNRSLQQSFHQPLPPPSLTKKSKFKLYKDENEFDSNELPTSQPLRSFPSRDTMQTENNQNPARWTECGSSKFAQAPGSLTTPFKVHQDPVISESASKKVLPQSVLHERKGVDQHEFQVALQSTDKAEPNTKPMYCKNKFLDETKRLKILKNLWQQDLHLTKNVFVLVYAGGIEFSLEELRAHQYFKKRQEQLKESQNVMETNQGDGDEMPAKHVRCSHPATFENGREQSVEELRAIKYLKQPVSENLHAELQNPNLQFMCDANKFIKQEISFEEFRALQYILQSRGIKERACHSSASTPSAASSRGTTPSSTPGLFNHLSYLGQSMTLNTKEAMAAMKDLWCSRRESPIPSPEKPVVAPFTVFCDSQVSSIQCEYVYRDEVPSRSSSGPKRGLQLAFKQSMKFETDDLGCQELWPQEEPGHPGAPFQVHEDHTEHNKHDAHEVKYIHNVDTVDNVCARKFTIFEDESFDEQEPEMDAELQKPWPIYKDPTECFELPYVAPPAEELYDMERPDKENEAPFDYEQPKDSREVHGILSEAINVPFVPLNEQNNEEEETDETQFGQQPTTRFIEDVTCLTSVFKQTNFSSSTPFHEERQSLLSRLVTQDEEGASNWAQAELGTTIPLKRDLSVILEVTGESRGSRSGSSTGSTNTTSHVFSKTPGQFSSVGDSRLVGSIEKPVRVRLLELDEDIEAENLVAVREEGVRTIKVQQQLAALNLSSEELDPFCENLRGKLLSVISLPLNRRPGYQRYECLLPNIRVHQTVTIGNREMKITNALGEGAYAKVYEAGMLENKHLALKVAHYDISCWDFYISTEIQYRLNENVMVERYSKMQAAHSYENGVIYEMDFISNKTLMDAVNHYKLLGVDMPMEIAVYFTIEILEILQTLHSINIIHCDVKPDNFLLMPSDEDTPVKLHIIDFGRCIDMKLFPKGVVFNQVFKMPEFRCVEMRTKRPWTYQLDLYGVAATLHCLLFGKYMNIMELKGKWTPTCKPKRFWHHGALYEELFDTLLNVSSCDDLPDLLPIISKFKQFQANACKKLILNKELHNVLNFDK